MAARIAKRQKTVILVDGDIALYKVLLSCEQETEWEPDQWTLHCDFGAAKGKILDYVEELCNLLRASSARVALSCNRKDNFRTKLYPEYKAHRNKTRKPMCYPQAKEFAKAELGALEIPTLEADDILGIEASTPTKDERIIVSIDKDFKGVPCKLYNPDNPGEGVRTITKEQADYWHLIQAMAGDAVDGYSGCPGVGVKTAEKLLEPLAPEKYWGAIVDTYKHKGLTEKDALINARLARILRYGEYNHETGEVNLWTPEQITSKN